MKTATIRLQTADVTEVLLYDMIGRDSFFGDGIGAKEFREQLKAVKTPRLNLRINSPGGSVTEAAAMLQALDEHPAEVEVDVDGLAASAASVLMMAGKKIRVATNGLVMIHNPHAGVIGDAAEMRRMADLLDKVKDQIIDAYRRKATATRAQLSKWMDAETWFTGKEAVEAGLADEASKAVNVAAFADLMGVVAKLGAKNVPTVERPAAEVAAATRAREETERRRAIAARL